MLGTTSRTVEKKAHDQLPKQNPGEPPASSLGNARFDHLDLELGAWFVQTTVPQVATSWPQASICCLSVARHPVCLPVDLSVCLSDGLPDCCSDCLFV